MKYTTVIISGIITQIAKKTDVEGYTEGVIEIFYPDSENMTEIESNKWIKENNKRMQAICDFLNESDL